MLGKLKNFLIATGASTLVVLSLVGSISGTLSWFTYTAKTNFTYHGTSISSNKQLQVGIVTDEDLSDFNFDCDEGIAWTLAGAGLAKEQINEYLSRKGFATDELSPLTSRSFKYGDDLTLYNTPYDYRPDNLEVALKEEYVQIPLAFRVINVGAERTYEANKDVWITQASVGGREEAGFNIKDGVRVNFANDDTKFIFNPSKEEKGSTPVSGLLDLNEDGYYDDDHGKEIVYGDFTGTVEYGTALEADSELDDINNTGKDIEYVFNSKHRKGVQPVSNFDDIVINEQEYETLKSVMPDEDDDGLYCDGLPVCNTGEDKVGYTTMTIWVEGWDRSVVDQVYGLTFDLDITFEINKV